MSISINRDYTTTNPNNTGNRGRKGTKSDYRWIVVHYVGACNWKTGFESTAKNNCIYYRDNKVGASANFYVDSTDQVYQSVPWDSERYAWHCGIGSKNEGIFKYLVYDNDGVYCCNPTAIGVEICTCKMNPNSRSAYDNDWYFDPRTYNNAVEFVKYLMKEFNIDINHVIRHHDVNSIHKLCPSQMVGNDVKAYYNMTGEQLWQKFKSDLVGVTPSPEPKPENTFPSVPFTVDVIVDDLNIRTEPSMNGVVVGQTGVGTFTITEVSGGWGRLKSGLGWIYIKNPEYCTIGSSYPAVTFKVKVLIPDLNYRTEPSMQGTVKGQTGKGIFTIVEVQNDWGKLKSGAGWIYIGNPDYCTIIR